MSAPTQFRATPNDSLDLFAPDDDLLSDLGNLYCAGDDPTPGLYRQVDGPRTIQINPGDRLPASFDGRVACYRRVRRWEQIAALSH